MIQPKYSYSPRQTENVLELSTGDIEYKTKPNLYIVFIDIFSIFFQKFFQMFTCYGRHVVFIYFRLLNDHALWLPSFIYLFRLLMITYYGRHLVFINFRLLNDQMLWSPSCIIFFRLLNDHVLWSPSCIIFFRLLNDHVLWSPSCIYQFQVIE